MTSQPSIERDQPAMPCAAACPPPESVRRGAVVLVHGAWVGEWCWAPIVPLLHARGRAVHTVSLTGHGTRRHESGSHISLANHVDDLAAVLEIHDLVDATVVAHSYGGRVLTKAWPEIAARVWHLVYLDAHAPVGCPQPAELLLADFHPAESGMVPMTGFEPSAHVLGGDDARSWFLDRVTPQSLATLTEPFWTDLPSDVRKTYVRASKNRDGRFDAYAAAARDRSDWGYVEIPGDHWLMYTHPDAVVDAILRPHDRVRQQETTP